MSSMLQYLVPNSSRTEMFEANYVYVIIKYSGYDLFNNPFATGNTPLCGCRFEHASLIYTITLDIVPQKHFFKVFHEF